MDYESQQSRAAKTPPEYRNGPIQNQYRSITDPLFCALLLIYFLGIVAVGVYAIKNGNPSKIVQGYDPDHRACGIDSGVEDYPYVYFAVPKAKYLYRTVCVSQCPKQGDVVLDCKPNSVVTQCNCNPCSLGNNVGTPTISPSEQIIIYDSKPFGNRVCIPTNQKYEKSIDDDLDANKMQDAWNDIKSTKYILLGALVFAFVVSFAFVYFLDKFAACLIWSFICFLFGVMLYFSYQSYQIYDQAHKIELANQRSNTQQGSTSQQVQSQGTNPQVYLVASLIIMVIAFIFITCIVCQRKNIKLTIAVLKTGGQFLEENWSIVRVPIITYLFYSIFFVGWVIFAIYLYSCGDIDRNKSNELPFGQLQSTKTQKYMGYYLFGGLIWILSFLTCSVDFVTSGTVCDWYFQQGKSTVQMSGNVSAATRRYLHYHTGTVAFGSLLQATISILRFFLQQLSRSRQAQDNDPFTKFIVVVCICCVTCFEKCLKAINQGAYTQTNMTGKSYCTAGAEAFQLMVRNASKYLYVFGLGDTLMILGKFAIAFICGFTIYETLRLLPSIQNNLVYPTLPVIVAGLMGYSIGSMFMSLYGISIQAILQVFCMDEEMESHFGKSKAALCPPALKEFLDDNSD